MEKLKNMHFACQFLNFTISNMYILKIPSYFNYTAEGSIFLWNISVNLQATTYNSTGYQNTEDYNLNNPCHKTWKLVQNRRKYESDIDLVSLKLF